MGSSSLALSARSGSDDRGAHRPSSVCCVTENAASARSPNPRSCLRRLFRHRSWLCSRALATNGQCERKMVFAVAVTGLEHRPDSRPNRSAQQTLYFASRLDDSNVHIHAGLRVFRDISYLAERRTRRNSGRRTTKPRLDVLVGSVGGNRSLAGMDSSLVSPGVAIQARLRTEVTELKMPGLLLAPVGLGVREGAPVSP